MLIRIQEDFFYLGVALRSEQRGSVRTVQIYFVL